ncbi:MAG TPA: fluoride efflux transporter CrcB, partial [Caulobacter sp.]|nr:fluoride efflux transporter CrcB [Caulobacter sp.]
MDKLLLVAAGGATGAMLRYLTGIGATRALGTGWPWGTLTVNVVGGLAMGLLVGVLAQRGGADQERWRLLLGVGVLGGFTTFSAFSLDAMLLWQRGDAVGFLLYGLEIVPMTIGG